MGLWLSRWISRIKGGLAVNLKVGDFNSDGILDLVLAQIYVDSAPKEFSSISIMLGNGDGSFRDPGQAFNAPDGNLLLADFNNDGKLDIAVAGFTNGDG